MSNDVIKAIKNRVSIREYLPEDISDDKIKNIIEAAHLAPSAGNLQPWEFYVVKDKDKIKQLSQVTYEQDWINSSPVIIVISALAHLSADKYGERGSNLYVIQDTAAAIENLLLAAESYDLGSCWVGDFKEQEVKRILSINENSWPVALVTIGYPAGKIEETRPQKSVDDVLKIIN